MKYSIYDFTSIKNIPADTEEIHLVRPLRKKKLLELLKKCPSLNRMSMSASCLKRMTASAKKLIGEKGIAVEIQQKKGRAIGIELEQMLHAVEMFKDHRPLREIENVTGIPKSTVHYLVRKAARAKIKKGKETVHLK